LSTRKLIHKLRELGVKLNVVDGELKISAPKGVFTAELRDELTRNKGALLDLISAGDAVARPAAAPISQADRNKPIPLSFAQKRMWFLEEFEGGTSIYNIAWAMRIKGALNKDALEQSLNDLVARHESLRTTFISEGGEPIQVIADQMVLKLDETSLNAADQESIQYRLSEWSTEPFNLRTGPLLKARLIKMGPNDHVLMLVIHHIVSDAWSLDVLQREFFSFYFARCANTNPQLDELPIQFADYAVWQQQRITEVERKKQLGYWASQLAGTPPLLELPTDHPRPSEQSYKGARIRRLMSQQLRDSLRELARSNNATLFMVLLAAFDVLLYRYTGQEDVVIGTPIAGRQRTELEALIGLFLNTLVMRADLSDNPGFDDLLNQVQTTAMDAFAHQDLPFEKLVDELSPERNMSYSPIFQVLFMLQNAPATGQPLEGLEITPVEFDYGTAKFDLTLATGETPDGLVAEIEYSTDLFDAVTIEQMLQHYEMLLKAIVTNPAQAINELSLITPAECQLLDEWNTTAVKYPPEATLQSLLERQANTTPNATALIFERTHLSYTELNARANQLAHWLISQGTQPDDLIGVCAERSIEMVVALLGVIKAGLAYVPLDPEYPEQRLGHMLEDADVRIILTQAGVHAVLPAHEAEILELDTNTATLAALPTDNPAPRIKPGNLAYTIFTSGSTGRPKGVMNEHYGIVNRLLWMQDEYGLAADDRVLQKTPFSFDVSVWEFFWPLISGATLVVARPGGHKDPSYLKAIINSERITTIHFVPSMLQIFLQDGTAAECTALKQVICSGEALSHDLQTRFYSLLSDAGLHNLYGPTEAAIDVSYWACPRESTAGIVPIGRPVANTHIYIVDTAGNPTPVGVAGELWIGGNQVARGYANRPDLTAERFIADPFKNSATARVYRTGDLARYRRDGSIEFLGRIDHQVKLRGFRIELGEIEANLDALPEVEQSLVLLREDSPGNKQLIAYLTAVKGVQPDIPALRQQLHEELPDYMVPAAFVLLPEFPLMPNGKVNRNALPKPSGIRDVDAEFVPPRTAIEKALADIWSDLLRADRVGIHDNFFDLGGDSILSIQIITRAAKQGLQLAPKQVFRYQTIAELADVAGTVKHIEAEQGQVTGKANLIPVQHWLFAQQGTDIHHFNQSSLLEFDGELDDARIEGILHKLVAHHDALRLQFVENAAGWEQFIAAPITSKLLRCFDLKEQTAEKQDEVIQAEANALQASLNLTEGILIRAAVFHLGADRADHLLIVIHHLAVDGISWRILLEDLDTLYRQPAGDSIEKLPAKTSSVLDWARKLQQSADSSATHKALDTWLSLPWPTDYVLPVDHASGRNLVESVQTINISLDQETTRSLLQEVPRIYRTQINDILLAALAKAISNWTNSNTLFVDMEGHGRNESISDADVSRTVGWFTTIYPVAISVDTAMNTAALIKSTKEQLRQTPNNGFEFGLLRYLSTDTAVHEAINAIPQAPILFNYLGQFDQSFDDNQLFKPAAGATGPDQSMARERSHLIDINGSVFGGKLQMGFSYSKNLHEHATIENLAEQFKNELIQLINHCLQPEAGGFSPSDFPLAPITQQQLDELHTANPDLEEIYPITPMEHAMLFQSMLSAEADDQPDQLYLTQVVWTIEGQVDSAAFAKAWKKVVQRHETLRTSFHQQHLDQPLAVIHSAPIIELSYEDWRDLDALNRDSRLAALLHDDQQRGYALNNIPLMRVYLLQFGDTDFRFIWSHHHIIIDGWSIPLVLDDLFAAYNATISNTELSLPVAAPYKAYVEWLLQQDQDEAEQFWRQSLAGFDIPTPLPASKKPYRGLSDTPKFAKIYISLPTAETQQLRQLAKQMRLTINTLAQGMWALLLARYTGKDDIVFGATSSGRPSELKNVELIVGLFLNTIPVRIRINPATSIKDWLSSIQEQQLAAREHEYASMIDIQGWSDVPRGTSMFDSLFIFENYPDAKSLWSDRNALKVKDMQADSWTNFPLSAAVSISNQLTLRLSYDTEYFDADVINKLVAHFEQLAHRIIAIPEANVADLLRPDDPKEHRVIESAARPASAFTELPSDAEEQSITARFEAIVDANGDMPAAQTATATWTYEKLNAHANAVAHELLNSGLEHQQLVGVLISQDLSMLAALLGILKAGMAYVPLDPESPPARHRQICTDAGVKAIVSDLAHRQHAAEVAAHLIPVLEVDSLTVSNPTNPSVIIDPQAMAYILFTSGSTGTPKGVIQNHRNVLHHCRTYTNALHIDKSDRLSLLPPYGFDAAVMDIFGALLNGACLQIYDLRNEADPATVTRSIAANKLSIFHSTPTVFRFLLEADPDQDLSSVRLVVLGGEEARSTDFDLFRQHFPTDAIFVNGLGPSESTLALQFFANHDTQLPGVVVPVGRPVDGTEIILLDDAGNLAGISGELAICSDFVTPGYWNAPELTAAAFIDIEQTGKRAYRTGDQARYLPDGQLVFMGRKDAQVKLRGHRIEAGEIEAVMLEVNEIQNCAVLMLRDKRGADQLVAYLTATTKHSPDIDSLRKALRDKLPAYMVPAAYIVLQEIPLTANGKLDRNRLPQPEWEAEAEYVAPRTATEEILAAIWSDVLNNDRVGINDDFFALGGHSLLATKLISRVRDALNIEAELRLLFSHPTVAEFAVQLETEKTTPVTAPIAAVRHEDGAPLSFAQQRLWFLDQLEGDNPAYHMFAPVRMTGKLQTDALQAAVNSLVERHESLRTTFTEHEGEPIQLVAAFREVPVKYIAMMDTDDASIAAKLAELVRQPYDLATGPLFSVQMLRLRVTEHVLVILIHHIISDAWSMEVMYRDLLALYREHCGLGKAELPDLTVQYADYACWQRELQSKDEIQRQLHYWREHLRGSPTAIDLPTDRSRPAVQTYAGNAIRRHISAQLNNALGQLARDHGATQFMVLQAAFDVLLARYSGQDDIVIGTPIAGRKKSELEGLIGFFVNMLIMRADLSTNPSFTDLLTQVRTRSLEAHAHQDLPFEQLVEELQPARDPSRAPLFQIAFTVATPATSPGTFPDLQLEPVQVDFQTAKFDLFMSMTTQKSGINILLEYNTDLFDAATIERMLDHFETLLTEIVADPLRPVKELPLMNAAERQQVLVDWNTTSTEYPADSSIQQIFETQVAQHPDRTALVCREERISYGELNQRANRMAHFLIELGIGPESIVALCMDRGIDALTGILAILKAGGAYAPLDPDYPTERLSFMLADCGSTVLLSHSSIDIDINLGSSQRIDIDRQSDTLTNHSAENPPCRSNGHNLAYTIYTSGSTGQPKGTLIENCSVLRLVINNDFTDLDQNIRIAMLAPISFDASTLEIWGSLLNGSQCIIYPDRTPALADLRNFLSANEVNLIFITTTLFNTIIDADAEMLRNVSTIITGGETASVPHIAKASQLLPDTQLIHAYGPTESTTFTTTYSIPRQPPNWRNVPIGKPIANTTTYILDEYKEPVPIGIIGELYIGGDGLSRGYLHQPELTADRFITAPWRNKQNSDNGSGAHLYRTGDLARFQADGNIEFIGRTDDQVKLRGFRIELGEIENCLRLHPAVNDAAVIVHEVTDGEQRLVAYTAPGLDDATPTLLPFMEERLPRYMVPSTVMALDEIPRTANGKVDRKSLPSPTWESGNEYVAPGTPVEKMLADIWKHLLKADTISINDDFFELGGHSLLTIKLIQKISKATGQQLTIADVFENPTIREFSLLLDTSQIREQSGLRHIAGKLLRLISGRP
jgi:amino acid adenylation domain-containing protein/non-ribosomal peptide synthase protein (TIGR01720 family)